MRNLVPSFFSALLACCTLLAVPAHCVAANGDCGQPASVGNQPTTADALGILLSAVGLPSACDPKPCLCDVTSGGGITAGDSLRVLQRAVGLSVDLVCSCATNRCTSATLTVLPGSEIDRGWTGIAHNAPVSAGYSIEMDIVGRCSSDDSACTSTSQCPSAGVCVPSCDCVDDNSCELAASNSNNRCLTTLTACTRTCGGTAGGKECSDNADCGGGGSCYSAQCPVGVACVPMAGPPTPFSSGGTPTCQTSAFTKALTGTTDLVSGELVLSAELRARTSLGIALSQPCPRCGEPSGDLRVGDQFVCEGGQFHGAACSVDAITENFGGTSFDCPAELNSGTSGPGLFAQLSEITTATTTRTAKLPCGSILFRSNPLNAPDNPGKCLDNNDDCSSNADCMRCSDDSTFVCTNNSDCEGVGTCAEAPDQPITCGYWCQCGFCDNNGDLPCFEDSDCSQEQTCVAGTGSGTARNSPQQKPNDCTFDKFVCGEDGGDECATTQIGSCSEQPYRNCIDDSTCVANNAGLCGLKPRSCFEPRITRSGQPSPLGSYCAFENKTCSNNTDCTGTDDFCVKDSTRPTSVALLCVPASASSAINSAGGFSGPAAYTFEHRLVFHREPQP